MSRAEFKAGYDKIQWRPMPPIAKPEPSRRRSNFPTPMVISDTQDATQSMANGEYYESKRALERSYSADGNPQGRDYTVIGNTPIEEAAPAKVDTKALRETLEKTAADVASGNVPDAIKAIE